MAFSLATVGAASAAVPLTASSSAAAFNMDINLDGQKTSVGNQIAAAGHAPPAYNIKNSLPSYSKGFAAPGGASVSIRGGSVTSTASSAGPAYGQITSIGQSAAGTFNVTVGLPVVGTLISISGGNLVSRAAYTLSRNGARKAAGHTDIGNVVINAPLLGLNNKSFSGSPKVNQVLFQTPDKSVTVYLNRQTETMAAGKPTSITVDAIAVVIDKTIQTFSLGADIVIGTAVAN